MITIACVGVQPFEANIALAFERTGRVYAFGLPSA